MATIPQYYDGTLAPLIIDADDADPARAWASQRARFRAYLSDLPEDAWSEATRCPDWDLTGLVKHLVSGAQFLSYSLYQSGKGVRTDLLRDFDTQVTPGAAAQMLDGLDREGLLAAMAETDASIEALADKLGADGWEAVAESPAGNVRAHLSINHFMFDSWVHEHDVMLPRGEQPVFDPLEAEVTARYLLGLAGGAIDLSANFEVQLTDLGRVVGIHGDGQTTRVTVGDAPTGAPLVEGTAGDVIDRATGRDAGPVTGDAGALAVIDAFAKLLARAGRATGPAVSPGAT